MSHPPGSIAVDSNVVIAFLRGAPIAVSWVKSRPGIVVPVPVLAEVRFGALNADNPTESLDRATKFFAAATVLPIDTEAGLIASEVRLGRTRAGRPIPQNDIWIAACCLRHQVQLATLDAHLLSIPELAAFRPW